MCIVHIGNKQHIAGKDTKVNSCTGIVCIFMHTNELFAYRKEQERINRRLNYIRNIIFTS